MSLTTAWLMVKWVMTRIGISGPQATAKGLQHGFGDALVMDENLVLSHIQMDLMGHSFTATIKIMPGCWSVKRQKWYFGPGKIIDITVIPYYFIPVSNMVLFLIPCRDGFGAY